MKLFVVAFAIFAAQAAAFVPFGTRPTQNVATRARETSRFLFGGKKEGGGGGQPGMMDQLAMFKKAQEIAKKKKEIDEELSKAEMFGNAAHGKIKVQVKYVPPQGPMNPSPGFDVVAVDIDEEYLESTSAEDLSTALVEAVRDGETNSQVVVAEKYQSLQSEVMAAMGGLQGAGGEAPASS